jgi:hypothetical protein
MPKTKQTQPKIISDTVLGQHLQMTAIKAARIVVAVYAAGLIAGEYCKKLNPNQYFVYPLV